MMILLNLINHKERLKKSKWNRKKKILKKMTNLISLKIFRLIPNNNTKSIDLNCFEKYFKFIFYILFLKIIDFMCIKIRYGLINKVF